MPNPKTALKNQDFEPVNFHHEDKEKIAGPTINVWKERWQTLKNNKGATISLFLLLFIMIMAVVGPYISEYSYYETNYDASFQPPNSEYWLGADKFGRDQWTRIWEGTRVSLYIAFLAAFLDLVIGVTFGAISAFFGGKVDLIMQRIIDILIGIPNLIAVILLILFLKPGIFTISLAMVITGWVNMARIVRAEIFKLREQEYPMAAKALGAGNRRIIIKHFLPNTASLILINLMFTIPTAIFTEAFLSFIGLGLQEPMASLGVLINKGYQSLQNNYYLLVYPAVVIIVLMVCFNLLADGLRDAFDPKMQK